MWSFSHCLLLNKAHFSFSASISSSVFKPKTKEPNTLYIHYAMAARFRLQNILTVEDGSQQQRHLPQAALVLVDGGEAVSVDSVEVVLVGDP